MVQCGHNVILCAGKRIIRGDRIIQMIQQKRDRKRISKVAECISRFLSDITVFAAQGIDERLDCIYRAVIIN